MNKPVHTKILIEFDALYDIAYGIIKYIKHNINNDDMFNQNVINADNLTLLNMLHSRREFNPLYLAFTDKYANDTEYAESLYKEILEKRYAKVLKLSPQTDIFGLAKLYSKVEGFSSISIICNKSIEEQFINDLEDISTIIYTGFDTNVNDYDVLIVNDYANVLKYHLRNPIGGKEIIIFDCKYNMEPGRDDNMPLLSITGLVSDINIIKTICPYAKFEPAKG